MIVVRTVAVTLLVTVSLVLASWIPGSEALKHDLPDNVELVDPASLGLSSQLDLDKLLGNVKILPFKGSQGNSSQKTQILTVGFDGDENVNLDDFELPPLPSGDANKELAMAAFDSFKDFFKNGKEDDRGKKAKTPSSTSVFSSGAGAEYGKKLSSDQNPNHNYAPFKNLPAQIVSDDKKSVSVPTKTVKFTGQPVTGPDGQVLYGPNGRPLRRRVKAKVVQAIPSNESHQVVTSSTTDASITFSKQIKTVSDDADKIEEDSFYQSAYKELKQGSVVQPVKKVVNSVPYVKPQTVSPPQPKRPEFVKPVPAQPFNEFTPELSSLPPDIPPGARVVELTQAQLEKLIANGKSKSPGGSSGPQVIELGQDELNELLQETDGGRPVPSNQPSPTVAPVTTTTSTSTTTTTTTRPRPVQSVTTPVQPHLFQSSGVRNTVGNSDVRNTLSPTFHFSSQNGGSFQPIGFRNPTLTTHSTAVLPPFQPIPQDSFQFNPFLTSPSQNKQPSTQQPQPTHFKNGNFELISAPPISFQTITSTIPKETKPTPINTNSAAAATPPQGTRSLNPLSSSLKQPQPAPGGQGQQQQQPVVRPALHQVKIPPQTQAVVNPPQEFIQAMFNQVPPSFNPVSSGSFVLESPAFGIPASTPQQQTYSGFQPPFEQSNQFNPNLLSSAPSSNFVPITRPLVSTHSQVQPQASTSPFSGPPPQFGSPQNGRFVPIFRNPPSSSGALVQRPSLSSVLRSPGPVSGSGGSGQIIFPLSSLGSNPGPGGAFESLAASTYPNPYNQLQPHITGGPSSSNELMTSFSKLFGQLRPSNLIREFTRG